MKPVRCVIDHLHRDLERAADARVGRFTHAGVTLDLGTRPDWLHGGLDTDEEWRIEWVKSSEGLALAHDFSTTGDHTSLETWQDLVESFCNSVCVGHDPSEVSARRIQNWVYAAQRFEAGPSFAGFRSGFEQRFRKRVLDDVAHLEAHLTPERNHRTLELFTLVVVGAAFDDEPMVRRGLDGLADNAATDIWDDGVHRECSPDYHMIVLRSLVGALAIAGDLGLATPDTLVERTSLAADAALAFQRPDGTTPAISDGDEGRFGELFVLAGEVLGRADLTWAGTGGRAGEPPATASPTFPVGGYIVWRSGWGETRAVDGERWGIFDVGPLGDGGHGHYDQLSVELVDGRHHLVIDPGRYTYTDECGEWRRWFKGTRAHNTVCVDGLDQTPYRRGRPKAPLPDARLTSRTAVNGPGPAIDLAVGRMTTGTHDATHTRSVAFVDGAYWVVHDHLDAPTAHRYEQRWHLPEEAWNHLTVEIDDDTMHASGPHQRLSVPTWCGVSSVEPGWVSRTYGHKSPAPVVVIAVEGATSADFITVLAGHPGPDHSRRSPDALPPVDTLRADVRDGRVQVVLHRDGLVDVIGWAVDDDGVVTMEPTVHRSGS